MNSLTAPPTQGTVDELKSQTEEYFGGDKLAANVYLTKYALKTPDGIILEPTPVSMHRRLAKELARIEAKFPNPLSENTIFDHLDQFKDIIPQGSPMAGIGNPNQLMSLSNCFVLPSPFDSMSGISMTTAQEKEIMKRRGGVGFDISTIRPKNMPTSNAAGTTDGISVFMDEFSDACRRTAQNGRRGALMLTVSVHHPEIRTFINIKRDKTRVTGANISIRLTDEFMSAVENRGKVELRFPVDSLNPKVREEIDAYDLWKEIVLAAHECAEPGALFWDNVLNYCPANNYSDFLTISTNPCGEITLSAYDSCRLLLVNVIGSISNYFRSDAAVDWDRLATIIQISQRLMDDIIELELECIDRLLNKINNDPEPEQVKAIEKDLWTNVRAACANGRRTGLGLTGVGDLIAGMNFVYGSPESISFVEKLYKHLAINAYTASIQLAKERGAFPAYDYEVERNDPYLARIWEAAPHLYEEYKKYGRRNIALLTTPPAGTTSLLAKGFEGCGVTSGIENVFMVKSIRRKKINPSDHNAKIDFVDELGDKWTEFPVYHNGFTAWKNVTGKTDKEIHESPYWGSTVKDVDPIAKVRMQGVAQFWIDHSISNTTNLPETATVEDVEKVYFIAWKTGCKGVTVYREGTRTGVLLDSAAPKSTEQFVDHDAIKRPVELECDVYHATVQGEKWTVFVGLLQGKPYEIMGGLTKHISLPKRVKKGKIVKNAGKGSATYDFYYDFDKPEDEASVRDIGNIFENAINAAFTRAISLNLRHGVSVQYVVEQLTKGSEKESDFFSFSRAVSRVLKNYIKDGTKTTQKTCPECSSPRLSYQSGCVICLDCGGSKCA